MAAINDSKEMNCQINISGIEENLKTLTKDDNAGRIILKKEVVTGDISRLRLKSTNNIIDGIYLIQVFPKSASHAIVLQISNNGNSFNVYDPNGQIWVNAENEYTLEVYVDHKKKNLKKSLSPKKAGLNDSGICGIWSIIISILLNGIVKEIFTEEDKELFYNFLNTDRKGAIDFIKYIKINFFDTTKHYQSIKEVNTFLKHMRHLLREIIDKHKKNTQKKVTARRKSTRLSIEGGKKSRKSSTSTSKSRSKSRSKSLKRK